MLLFWGRVLGTVEAKRGGGGGGGGDFTDSNKILNFRFLFGLSYQ